MSKEVTMNKMGTESIPKIMLQMGIPMIVSMVLQACYNIVDSVFVARIPDANGITNMGEYAVNALTLAFSIAEAVALLVAVILLNRVNKCMLQKMEEK